jgi:transcription elongation factor GreA-like protein/transcription elongation GreA/GreB family factor
MSYLEEFKSRLAAREYHRVLELWQEYCESDELDVDELIQILRCVKLSECAQQFGQYVEAILPLVMAIPDGQSRFEALCQVYDVQTSQSESLWDLAQEILTEKFGKDPLFREKLRLANLRTKGNFQGALSNFALLNHIAKGNFVIHNAGWGVGQIVDFSFLREQVTVEFENLGGSRRDISFKNGFRSLEPIPADHFLAMRLANPSALEKKAHEDSVSLVMQLLRDMGPKDASEIKDLLSDYVIDEELYSKWWQATRTKLKKDGHVEVPQNPRDRFSLRKAKLSLEERLKHELRGKSTFSEVLVALYSMVRDFPGVVRNSDTKNEIIARVQDLLKMELGPADQLQVYFFMEQLLEENPYAEAVRKILLSLEDWNQILCSMEIVSFRKQLLKAIRLVRPDWEKLFADMLLVAEPSQLKDFIVKELSTPHPHPTLTKCLEYIVDHPVASPETFIWYFQKANIDGGETANSQKDKERLFEGFLLLLSALEQKKEHRELVKRMLAMFTGQRFKIVRDLLKDTDKIYAQEFLLIASKCHSLSAHDQNILRSLVDVVHGGKPTEAAPQEDSIIWTTQEGFEKVKERIRTLGTVEIVENAREIEAARALGDLRENSEFKFALERRSRLQNELKQLSDQFHKARVITTDDIVTDTVGVGSRVYLKGAQGTEQSVTILGPWDADPDKNILSLQSKVAQSLSGKKVGSQLEFLGEPVTITRIESYLARSKKKS